MVILACPDSLFNKSVDVFRVYVSELMRRLITDPRYRRGPDGKHHHYQAPCCRLQEYIIVHVPRDVAGEVTVRLMRKVSLCYSELITDGRFRSACEEIAPYIFRAVVHPSVKCLNFVRNKEHPTLLDYHKEVNGDLVYRTLPLLRDLKVLKIGKMATFASVSLDVEGFRDSLEKFSTSNYLEKDIEELANKCKRIRCLDLGGTIIYPSNICNLISRFEYLEELNLSLLRFLSNDDLEVILYWLFGFLPLYRSPSQKPGVTSTLSETSSQTHKEALMADLFRNRPLRHSGQLKSFGCANARVEHIDLICMFYNLTSLVLCDLTPSCSLLALRYLNRLKNLTLIRSHFSDVEEFLKVSGNQLICLNFADVFGTIFTLVSQKCRSLECLHLCFSRPEHLILPANYRDVDSHSLSFPDFPLVVTLQLYITENHARGYILSRFPNLRKLALLYTGDDLPLLDSIVNRTRLVRLEEFYWGLQTVMVFSDRPPCFRSSVWVHE